MVWLHFRLKSYFFSFKCKLNFNIGLYILDLSNVLILCFYHLLILVLFMLFMAYSLGAHFSECGFGDPVETAVSITLLLKSCVRSPSLFFFIRSFSTNSCTFTTLMLIAYSWTMGLCLMLFSLLYGDDDRKLFYDVNL